ncbi:MAG: SAM-dependent MidA family methyltransferase [Alphaproteobacteria bacterium]|jgi:SAM-dependent MidA family methyltransferase
MTDSIIHQYLQTHDFITLEHYMQLCLQHETHGYYRTGHPIGKQGDFITAPEISQIFGELIGIFINFHKQTLFTGNYQICELGAGKGTLAKDYLRSLNKTPPSNVFFLESNQHFKDQQLVNIPNAKHINTLNDLPHKPTLFLANEFFDALPIQVFKVFGAQQSQVIVKLDDKQKLKFDYASAIKNTTSQISGFYETSPMTLAFCEQIATHIKNHQGAFLLCDYGYDTMLDKISFRGFQNHKVTDGLQSPCHEDLTADVNFALIMDHFYQKNLKVSNLCTQAEFLKSLHIETRLHKLLGCISNMNAKELMIQGVQKLISPQQMGNRFKFLCINQHDTPLYPFTTFYKPPL